MLCKDFLLEYIAKKQRCAHMSLQCYDRNTDRNRHNTHYWLPVCYRSKNGAEPVHLEHTSSPSFCIGGADILSCSCSFMFTADSMRGPSLDDTRIFRPAPHTEGCKGFYRADPSPSLPSMGGSSYNWLMPSPTFSPWDRGEYPAGGRGWIKLSAHSCRNEVCDHSSASVEYGR